jgi:hypothetical protein
MRKGGNAGNKMSLMEMHRRSELRRERNTTCQGEVVWYALGKRRVRINVTAKKRCKERGDHKT